ncbi:MULTISPECIES: pentapeptide repeat-containing protein [unclassified Coleofasciculus]|uniref:pentapeptide repeat-containing protein n=1 Tax=unclassified Coleofasciculus TaxID=2692782 RepID=UPI00187FAA01|nr:MULTISPECIES: pentapeptide repeat-containing protein [unclassified Coleofasciculus]MBE9127873.1 pentapeptide repeat-containing protein [Coleofasciculus sp. LEGE 07081]MBE9151065.1 pentapeptide repeat-containing protein [Coleofasciculus sp. LEGE 07092]
MTNQPEPSQSNQALDSINSNTDLASTNGKSLAVVQENHQEQHLSILSQSQLASQGSPTQKAIANPSVIILSAIAILIVGLALDNFWIGVTGVIVTLLLSVVVLWSPVQRSLNEALSPQQQLQLVAICGVVVAVIALAFLTGFTKKFDSVGSLAEWIGALGQILIAILAVYIAWRQYIISKDLTIQQNIITQQQTIDAYFQGISDLALDDEGLLEDWPQERAFCEGRTAAILSSVDALGKAKVLRFLSQSRLLTPLKRDRHLGRPMLDGDGGYQEDRLYGVRVIELNVMLAGADLTGTDLRWTELSDANMVRANLSLCDLVGANLSRTILYEAILAGADMRGVRLFYGLVEIASPRSRIQPPNYQTGAYTGAVVEGVNFTAVKRLDDEQRKYCCYWCGEQSRKTIPGGCEGIENKLGR